MRRKTIFLSASVLVFVLMFTACAARGQLQTPVQPRQGITNQYDNNRGIGAGTDTYTGIRSGYTNPYDTGYGMGTTGIGDTTYYGGYGGYRGYGGNNYGMNKGYGNDYRNIGGSNTSPNYGIGTVTTQTERLSRACETIPGVDTATVVISGDTAYVGVNTGRALSGKNTFDGSTGNLSTLKGQCASKIRAANSQIKTVYVSTDTGFFDRIRRVGDGIRNGTPAESFRNELSNLVKGLTPER